MLLIWIPVSIASNGRDVITGKEVSTSSGSSERHLGAIGEALARVSLSVKPRPFSELLREERMNRMAGASISGTDAGQKAVMEDILRTVAVPTEQFGRK